MELEEEFKKNYGLVLMTYNKYFKRNKLEEDDLIQEGSIGLMNAIKKFDDSKGCEFSTYAVMAIKRRMLYYLRGENRKRVVDSISIDDEAFDDGLLYEELIGDNCEEVNNYEVRARINDVNSVALRGFNDRDIKIVELWANGETMVDIGKKFSLSKARISDIIKKYRRRFKRLWDCEDGINIAKDKNKVIIEKE